MRYCPNESFSVSLDLKICDSLYQITPVIKLDDDNTQAYSLDEPYDLMQNFAILDPYKRYRVDLVLNNQGTYSLKVDEEDDSELYGNVAQDFSLLTEPELDESSTEDFKKQPNMLKEVKELKFN